MNAKDNICSYIAKNKKVACDQLAQTPYGFCNGHKSTVQGMTARGAYEAEQKKLAEKQASSQNSEKTEKSRKSEEDSKQNEEKPTRPSDEKVRSSGTDRRSSNDSRRSPSKQSEKPKRRQRSEDDEDDEENNHGKYLLSRSQGGYATLGELKKMTSRGGSRQNEDKRLKQSDDRKPRSENFSSRKPNDDKKSSTSDKTKKLPAARSQGSIPKTQAVDTPRMIKLKIKKNSFGHFEDTTTHIVFDPKSKSAFGVQLASGKLRDLDENDIEICRRNKWKYVEPDPDDDSDDDSYGNISQSEEEGSDSEESEESEDEDDETEEEDEPEEEEDYYDDE